MIQTQKPSIFFLIYSVAAAVVSAAIRIFLSLTDLDPVYGVYAHGALLPKIYHILLAILVLLPLAAAFLLRKRTPAWPAPAVNDASTFTGCAAGFLMGAAALFELIPIIGYGVRPGGWQLARLIVTIPAMLFFFAQMRKKNDGVESLPLTFASLFPTIWFSILLIEVYFDISVLITSPNRIIRQMAILSIMLYLLNETRFLLGRSHPAYFLGTSSAAVILLLTSSVPNLVLSSRLSIGESDQFLTYALEAVLALYILSRHYSYLRATPEAIAAAEAAYEERCREDAAEKEKAGKTNPPDNNNN